MIVIEMNPRVSRSSALASKATGFPIAKVAAKLAVGFTLDELSNDITGGQTPASFEPSIDYVVTKIPRFAFEKFPQADSHLTTQMKSVGEVMAIGRSFQESFQKALRGLEVGVDGLVSMTADIDVIKKELGAPKPERIWYLGDAFRIGMTIEDIFNISKIDPWFLAQIEDLIRREIALKGKHIADLDKEALFELKRAGFSDLRLAGLLETDQHAVRAYRQALNVRPVYKRVDTCAAELRPIPHICIQPMKKSVSHSLAIRKKSWCLVAGRIVLAKGLSLIIAVCMQHLPCAKMVMKQLW